MKRVEKFYIWTCALPQLSFWAMRFYAATVEEWSQWTTRPMLLMPISLSFIMLIMGMGLILYSRMKKESVVRVAIATLIAGSLILGILLRGIAMELAMSS